MSAVQRCTERLRPDIILTGHWAPLHVPADYFDKLADMGRELERSA